MNNKSNFRTDKAFALQMDKNDPLAKFKERFYLPDQKIYMDGNSLGLMSRDSEESIGKVVKDWKTLGIEGWLKGESPWFYYSEKLGNMMSGLIGAEPEEVICTGSTTVNIHSVLSTFYQPQGQKNKILADELNFPSDIYALQSQINIKGLDPKEVLILAGSRDGLTLDEDMLVKQMDSKTALVFLPSVLYRSGQYLNIKYLTQEAHKRNILIGFDCSHSAGAIPHQLSKWGVDFAVWCSYKYLNGGPGSPAFIYINKKHFNKKPRLTGWFGYKKDKQFDLLLDFDHQKSAGGWQISTPGIISSASLEGALNLMREAGINKIREKSVNLTSYLIFLIDSLLADDPYLVKIGTPREPQRRSGHVALIRKDGLRICQALKARGIIPDYRPKDLIRIAPVALYNSYLDVWRVVEILKNIIETREYLNFPDKHHGVS